MRRVGRVSLTHNERMFCVYLTASIRGPRIIVSNLSEISAKKVNHLEFHAHAHPHLELNT